tara:strand:- start:517 stop:981 length:465 start_codon:yes stop_codon:yes gene_type:complete
LKHLVLDIQNIANEAASDKGFEIVDIKLNTDLNPMTLQLQIRSKENEDISINDCALLSKPISEALDNSKLFDQPYVLEISSPGISEFLESEKDFETFKGFPVEVIFEDKYQSKFKKIGLLQEKSKDDLKLNLKGKISIIPLKSIMRVKLKNPEG